MTIAIRSSATEDSKTPSMIRADSYKEEMKAIRNKQTALIKHQESIDLRAAYLDGNETYQANRAKALPLLERRGITLNENDQLQYLPCFEAPELTTDDCWIVRHGETPGNVQGMRQGMCDGPVNQLNENGTDQAKKLRYQHNPCDVLFVSPLGRTQDTAKPIVLGLLDKGYRVKVTMDETSQQKGYFNKISLALRNNLDIGFDEHSGEFFQLDKAEQLLDCVDIKIDYDFREMCFGAKENESVHGVEAYDPSHLMEYDQNAIFKVEEDFQEDYLILDENGNPELYDDGKPKIGKRSIPSENFAELTLRAFSNMGKINEQYKGKRVGIVGHGIITRGTLITRNHELIKKDKQDQHLMIDGAQATKVPNGKMIDFQPKPLSEKVAQTLDKLSHIHQGILRGFI